MRRNLGPKNDGGFVMVTVLWMLVILTVITMGFSHRAMMERRMAWYTMDRAQAQSMARGAANRALLELMNKDHLRHYLREGDYDGLNQRWARPVNLLKEANYFSVATDKQHAGDLCQYVITDCASRISINDAPRELLENLDVFGFRAMDEVMEWRESAKPGEQSRRFLSVDEVLTFDDADDIDAGLWYGTAEARGIRSLLTVWGGERSDGRINVNTASREVLALIPGLSQSVVEQIIVYRNGPDETAGTRDDRSFKDLSGSWPGSGLSADAMAPILKYCKTNSEWFKISSRATRRRGKISAYCTVIVHMRFGEPSIVDWKEGIIGS